MELREEKCFLVGGFCEPTEVFVLKKNGEPYKYRYADDDSEDYYDISCDDVLFNTKEEARKYRDELMPVSDELIKRYTDWKYNNDKLEDVLSEDAYRHYLNGYSSCMCIDYNQREQLSLALRGILNIDAYSFRISDVKMVKSGDDWCTLTLKSGEEITPRDKVEVFIIKSIFGENRSSRVFKNIKQPEKI